MYRALPGCHGNACAPRPRDALVPSQQMTSTLSVLRLDLCPLCPVLSLLSLFLFLCSYSPLCVLSVSSLCVCVLIRPSAFSLSLISLLRNCFVFVCHALSHSYFFFLLFSCFFFRLFVFSHSSFLFLFFFVFFFVSVFPFFFFFPLCSYSSICVLSSSSFFLCPYSSPCVLTHFVFFLFFFFACVLIRFSAFSLLFFLFSSRITSVPYLEAGENEEQIHVNAMLSACKLSQCRHVNRPPFPNDHHPTNPVESCLPSCLSLSALFWD